MERRHRMEHGRNISIAVTQNTPIQEKTRKTFQVKQSSSRLRHLSPEEREPGVEIDSNDEPRRRSEGPSPKRGRRSEIPLRVRSLASPQKKASVGKRQAGPSATAADPS